MMQVLAGAGVVVAGVMVIVLGFRLLRKRFSGQVLVELPIADNRTAAEVDVGQAGVYALWIRGRLFKQTQVATLCPVIQRSNDNKTVRLWPSFMRPTMNDGVTGRMELYSFRLSTGRYTVVLPAGRSFRPGFTLQLRKGQAFYWFPASVLLLLVGAGLLVCGIIFGFFMDLPVFANPSQNG